MAIKHGTIDPLKLFKLFRSMFDHQQTGLLTFSKPNVLKEVYLHQGYPVFARSSLHQESLSAFMVKEGVISSDEAVMLETLQIQANPTYQRHLMDVGAFAVQRGLISADRLRDIEYHLMENIMTELLSWQEGQFTFNSEETSPLRMSAIHLIHLLIAAAQSGISQAQQQQLFESYFHQSVALSVSRHQANLTPQQAQFLRDLMMVIDFPEMVWQDLEKGVPVQKFLEMGQDGISIFCALLLSGSIKSIDTAKSQSSQVQAQQVQAQQVQAQQVQAQQVQARPIPKPIEVTEAVKDNRIQKVPDQWRKFNIASAIQQQAETTTINQVIEQPSPVMAPPPPPVMAPPPPPVMASPPPTMRPTAVSAKTENKKKPLTDALQKQISEIMDHYEKRSKYTHYEQLEIPQQADDSLITGQFKKKAAALHVDRFMRFDISEETLEKIKQVFISVNQAYQVLSNPQTRKEYDLSLKHTSIATSVAAHTTIANQVTHANVVGGVVQATQDLNQIFKAEKITKEALHFIKIGKIDLAIAKAKESLEINSEDVLALAAKTFGEFLQAKANQATVVVIGEFRDILQGLHANNDQREEILLYLGRVQLALNDFGSAKRSFEKAIALNPLFAEAKSELTLLLRRQEEEETKKKGLFGGFLKK